jgi:hypothetical protein
LGLTFLRFPCGSHSKNVRGSLFSAILFTCPNHSSRFSSVTSKMFILTSMIALMVPFRNFSFLEFLADLFQKSISVAGNLFSYCVFSAHVTHNSRRNKQGWIRIWSRGCKVLASISCSTQAQWTLSATETFYCIKNIILLLFWVTEICIHIILFWKKTKLLARNYAFFHISFCISSSVIPVS